MMAPFDKGFALGMGLIVAIGTQNAFVLKQGIRREHRFVTALVCLALDVLLITAGVQGLGVLIQQNPLCIAIAKWGGILFLGYYGFRSFRSALYPKGMQREEKDPNATLKTVVLSILALSLLNPHVYLDTVILLGSIGATYDAGGRFLYVLGASTASTLWFFSLAYGASFLTPFFAKPIAWRILDTLVGITMWAIAASLFWI